MTNDGHPGANDGLSGSYTPGRTLNDAGQKSASGKARWPIGVDLAPHGTRHLLAFFVARARAAVRLAGLAWRDLVLRPGPLEIRGCCSASYLPLGGRVSVALFSSPPG